MDGICPSLAQATALFGEPISRIIEDVSGIDEGSLATAKARASQQISSASPTYHSTNASEEKTFSGEFEPPELPEDKKGRYVYGLALFSDDGCDVMVEAKTIHRHFKLNQHLPDIDPPSFSRGAASFYPLPVLLKPGRKVAIVVDYSNTIYVSTPGTPGFPDIDGCPLFLYLVPTEIIEVAERDQKWNKVPNPKDPPGYWAIPMGYAFGVPAGTPERNILFVAVEPGSGKVELTVKSSPQANRGSGVTLLCGLRDQTASSRGPILPGSVSVSSTGETDIDFTPTGNLNDNDQVHYRPVLGIELNSNGKLTNDEVVTEDAPASQRFILKAVTEADYQDSLDYLDNRDNTPFVPVARSFLRYFDGHNSAITEGTLLSPLVLSASSIPNPTHIAGSAYDASTGITEIPRWKLADGTIASNNIEDTFDSPGGLRPVIHDIWDSNVNTLAAPFIADPSLRTSTSPPLPIAQGISFYDSGTNLLAAYGSASIRGTVVFGLERDPSDARKVILTSVDIDAIVEDVYDFDWTRLKTSASRQAAAVQIGWEPPVRNAGRIFATETEVKHLYVDDSAIATFNRRWWIVLRNRPSGP